MAIRLANLAEFVLSDIIEHRGNRPLTDVIDVARLPCSMTSPVILQIFLAPLIRHFDAVVNDPLGGAAEMGFPEMTDD